MYIYVYIYIDVYIYVYENEFVRLGGAAEGAVTRMSLNRALSVLRIRVYKCICVHMYTHM